MWHGFFHRRESVILFKNLKRGGLDGLQSLQIDQITKLRRKSARKLVRFKAPILQEKGKKDSEDDNGH